MEKKYPMEERHFMEEQHSMDEKNSKEEMGAGSRNLRNIDLADRPVGKGQFRTRPQGLW